MSHSTLVLCAAIATLSSLAIYVLLDGFDLGVGMLLKATASQEERDEMIEAIEPVWDGNETWLVMAGVALWAAFPIAYSTLLPAIYVPLIGMFVCLGFRGVSFEFRAESDGRRRLWDTLFFAGSLGAAFFQGTVLGGLLNGVAVARAPVGAGASPFAFAGEPLDFLTPSSVLCGCLAIAGYCLLGSGWLRLKTSGEVQRRSERQYRIALVAFALILIAVVAIAMHENAELRRALLARMYLTCIAGLASIGAAALSLGSPRTAHYLWGYAWSACTVGAVLVGLIGLIWPHIVPYSVTFEEASSPTTSLVLLLIGMVVVIPVILTYTYFAYWVFRERVESHRRPAA